MVVKANLRPLFARSCVYARRLALVSTPYLSGALFANLGSVALCPFPRESFICCLAATHIET